MSPTPTVWHFNKYNTYRFAFSPEVIKIQCALQYESTVVFIHITGEHAENEIVSTSCHQVLLNQNVGNIADALYAGQA